MLEPLRERADLIIDSSRFNVHELRRFIQEHFAPQIGGQPDRNFRRVVRLQARRADGIGPDVRHPVPAEPVLRGGLRGRSGLDTEVRDYLEAIPEYVNSSRASSISWPFSFHSTSGRGKAT